MSYIAALFRHGGSPSGQHEPVHPVHPVHLFGRLFWLAVCWLVLGAIALLIAVLWVQSALPVA